MHQIKHVLHLPGKGQKPITAEQALTLATDTAATLDIDGQPVSIEAVEVVIIVKLKTDNNAKN